MPRAPVALLVVAAVLVLSQLGVGRGSGPARPDPHRAALLAADREPTEAIVDFWAGRVEDEPATAAFRTQLAAAQLRLAAETGDLTLYETAEATATAAVGLDPEAVDARLSRARALAGQHDFAGAMAAVEPVFAQDPTSVAALLTLGDAQLELGRYLEAETSFRVASRELGQDPPALLSRYARLAAVYGDVDGARALADQALALSGDLDLPPADAAFYWTQAAHHHLRSGDLDEAATLLSSALIVDPDNLGAAEMSARVLAAQGRDQEAIAAYRRLLDRGPAPDLHGELAKLYERVGNPAAAQAQVEQGLRLARQTADRFPAERRHLIGFLADHDPAEALRLAELDLATRQDAQAHGWYAWALLQTGQPAAALEAIGPALQYASGDPWLLYQAGSVLAANGHDDEARRLLAAALDTSPTFDVVHAPRAARLLARLDRA